MNYKFVQEVILSKQWNYWFCEQTEKGLCLCDGEKIQVSKKNGSTSLSGFFDEQNKKKLFVLRFNFVRLYVHIARSKDWVNNLQESRDSLQQRLQLLSVKRILYRNEAFPFCILTFHSFLPSFLVVILLHTILFKYFHNVMTSFLSLSLSLGIKSILTSVFFSDSFPLWNQIRNKRRKKSVKSIAIQ